MSGSISGPRSGRNKLQMLVGEKEEMFRNIIKSKNKYFRTKFSSLTSKQLMMLTNYQLLAIIMMLNLFAMRLPITSECSPSNLNTTPASPSDSIGTPPLQPPTTTTSSISSAAPLLSGSLPPSPTTVTSGAESSATPTITSATSVPTTDSTDLQQNSSESTQTVVGAGSANQQQSTPPTSRQLSSSPRMTEDETDDSAVFQQQQQQRNPPQQSFDRQQGNSNNLINQQLEQMYNSPAQNSIHLAPASSSHVGGSGLSQSVSSSPSSISIITPLIGPPTQQQQLDHSASTVSVAGNPNPDSQSMMKPIFVLGQPLSEHDYSPASTSSLYYHTHSSGQYQPSSTVTAATSSLEEQQSPTSKQPTGSGKTSPEPAADNQQHSTHQQQSASPKATSAQKQASSRVDKSAETSELSAQEQMSVTNNNSTAYTPTSNSASSGMGERMSGPPLIYSDGHLKSSLESGASGFANAQHSQPSQINTNGTSSAGQQHPGASPRLFQSGPVGPSGGMGMVMSNTNAPRRPSLPPPVNQANAASGFRSPLSPSGPLLANQPAPSNSGLTNVGSSTSGQMVGNSLGPLQPAVNNHLMSQPNFYQNSPPYVGGGNSMNNLLAFNPNSQNAGIGQQQQQQPNTMGYNAPKQNFFNNQQQLLQQQQQQQQQQHTFPAALTSQAQQQALQTSSSSPSSSAMIPPSSGRRPLNITRVEHISAECSNDLIKAVVVFNGTFKGIIYSSGFVTDPTCLYINGTGSTRYEFNIRLNQCGTLGSEKLHQPTIPGEARRRDQVMWNTLSIQYNSMIEQEWDEHFKVSCEYGSDFWKTVSFSPFSVETNTGSPVVFTINPPQCQMDVLLGHGMGPKIAVDGPVTVGDPLTLLIHMKSEKAGYDILVKNCVAHNGGKQRMQLIDSNGCVVNERFISPFRGTYNDNDLRHVTLYAYLKAFRFTGTSILYLECEIHMCQSACPPQMCYWRRLSKRSVDNDDYEYTTNSSSLQTPSKNDDQTNPPIISDSLNLFKAIQVRQESEKPLKSKQTRQSMREVYAEDDEAALVCYRHTEVFIFLTTIGSLLILIITIAVTCWIRIRKLTRSQFKHSRLLASSSSVSPSLLSISDAISSSASSFINSATNGSLLSLSPSSHHHQMSHKNLTSSQCTNVTNAMLHHYHLQQCKLNKSTSKSLLKQQKHHQLHSHQHQTNRSSPTSNIAFFHYNSPQNPTASRMSPPHHRPCG